MAVGDFWKICIVKGTVSNLPVAEEWIRLDKVILCVQEQK
jgi:hypothetical protein